MNLDNVTGALTAFLIAALPISVMVTKGVDLVRNLIDGDGSLPKATWNVAAFAIGLGVCLGWQFNPVAGLAHAVPALTGSARLDGVAGQALSGFAVGAMSSFWHEKLSAWSAASKPPLVDVGGGDESPGA